MDYKKINSINVDNNGNIIMQDINGSTVTINYNDTVEFSKLISIANEKVLHEIKTLIAKQGSTNVGFLAALELYLGEPAEVKKIKENIAKKVIHFCNIFSDLENKNNENQDELPEIVEDKFLDETKWEFLIDAIKEGGCVLFIGQEISTDENGNSLHETFYKTLEKQFSVKYLSKEGFFAPIDNDKITYKVKKFYRDTFHIQNTIGKKLLTKLSQIPFSLIISLTPDNTIHRVFDDFDKHHQYFFFDDGSKQDIEKPTIENPLIYNILGEAEKDRYIFTHEQFYDYIRKLELNPEIKHKLQNATHFLFFGFDFNKWYKRLLLFFLKISERKKKAEGHAIEEKTIETEFENFVKSQFNITYISNNYTDFLNQLLQRTNHENLKANLKKDFIAKNLDKLQKIGNQIIDKNTYDDLIKLSKELDLIEKKIETFKKII